MNNSITQSNNIIHGQTLDLMRALEEKLKDPVTAERAKNWYPKAAYIHHISTELIAFLKNVKNKGFSTDSIIRKVAAHPDNVLKTDAKINETFKDSFNKMFPENSTLKSTLGNSDSISFTALINAIENSVRIAEAKALTFCNEQCPRDIFEFTVTSAIIVQNSSLVEKGMPIQITAGIGAFSTRNQAVVKINNKQIPLSENGAAIYTFKSSQMSGKHNVPVEIDYIDQDGKKIKFNKTITYTVAE